MDEIKLKKLIKKAVALRFPANDTLPPPPTVTDHSKGWALVAVLSLILGFGLNSKSNLNAKEASIPTLPSVYIEKNNIFNTDFTIPLPELNSLIAIDDNTCISLLETPPTLIKKLKTCTAPIDKQTQTINFSGNRYRIISKNI